MIRAIAPVPVFNLVYDKTLVPAAAAILEALRKLTNNNRELVIIHRSSDFLNGATLNLKLVTSSGDVRYTHHDLIRSPTIGIAFVPESISDDDAHALALSYLLMLGVKVTELGNPNYVSSQ